MDCVVLCIKQARILENRNKILNNEFLNPLFTAITTCFLLFSSGCTQEPATSSGLEHRSIYVDNRTLETDSFILEAQKAWCTDKIYNYQLRVYFDVVSKEEKKSQFITKDSSNMGTGLKL